MQKESNREVLRYMFGGVMSGFGVLKMFGRIAARQMPTLANAIWRAIFPLFRKNELWEGHEYNGPRQDSFETIYTENRWKSDESRSGTGSTLDQTIVLRRKLPKILSDLGVRTILDAPCGDYHWMQRVKLPAGVTYLGGEIVRPLVDSLNAEFGRPGVAFVPLDIVSDSLPGADVWLCRDVLFHLSNADIFAALRNFAKSNMTYILTTTYPFAEENRDITSGGFRYINLTKAPFHLPAPQWSVDDFLAPEPPRKLGLWSRGTIVKLLAS